jgi:hypothetical protein
MSEPVRRLSEGADDMAKLLGKAAEGTARPRVGSRERIWKTLGSERPRASAAWWLIPALATAAAVAFFVLRPSTPPTPEAAVATVVLSSGIDAHAGDRVSQLSVPAHGRAEVRLDTGELVLHERTRASFSRDGVRLDEGSLSARAHGLLRVHARAVTIETQEAALSIAVAGETVQLFVEEGRANAAGVVVQAKQSWSSSAGLGDERRAVPAPRPSGSAAVRVAKPIGAQVLLDGVELGTAPLEVMVSPGKHELTAVQGGRRSSLEAAVSAQGGSFEVPEAPLPPLPEVALVPVEPEPVPEAHPARVQPPPDPSKRYLVARTLAQHGRYAEALAIYEGLARGSSGWAEPSLYEVGRLKLRALKDAAGAEAALADYRARFARGSLAHEVALSEIEVQLKLGAGEAALHAMDDFLTQFPRSERRADVRFVRATVRRDRGDCAGATADYLELLSDSAHADDSLYFAAVCEQQAGADGAARSHLSEYLKRFPNGAHAADVRRFFEGGR